jgi:hypothetical protein
MTPQDFKAFLDVLNRIATALEGKDKNIAAETVNRFAEVYRMLEEVQKMCEKREQYGLAGEVLKIRKTHTKIATEILQINQQK